MNLLAVITGVRRRRTDYLQMTKSLQYGKSFHIAGIGLMSAQD
jgi:hypothetical protein